MDCELHRHARASRSRCLPRIGSRFAQGRGIIIGPPPARSRGILAAVALVRRVLSVGIASRKEVTNMLFHYDEFASPIGRILFASDGDAVCSLDFSGYEDRMQALIAKRYPKCDFQRGSDPMRLSKV